MGNPEFFGALGPDLGGIAVDRLAAAEDEIVVPHGGHGLGKNVTGCQRIASGGSPVGQKNGAVGAAVKRGAQDIGGLRRPHRDDRDRSSEPVFNFKGGFERVNVFGIKNRRKRSAVDGSVLFHRIAGDIGGVGNLFD